MPQTNADPELLKRIYQRLDPAEALEPDDERYEPLYQSGQVEDPVSRLKTRIDWNPEESLHLFSWFRGSGKTTELFRLRAELEKAGFAVLYANALDYLNPAEPVEISDLLMVVAGAFSDQLQKEIGVDSGGESFWQRFTRYLKGTCLRLQEATVKLGADSPVKDLLGGLEAGQELKLVLKETSSFKQRLREFLQNRLPDLKAQLNAFVEEGVQALRKKTGDPDKRIVFIFDQLEQLHGSASTEREVIDSVGRVFAGHLDKLQLPYVHAVYTVPPWLQFVLPGGTEIEVLPSLQLWKKDAARTRNPDRWKAVRRLIERRFDPDGYKRVFGVESHAEDQPLTDLLIEASGGYFRDLFRMLREMLVRIQTQAPHLPVSEAVVKGAIQRIREQYLPLSLEDARRLKQIAETRRFDPPRASPEEAASASRLLNLHLVFYFSNGEEWYDVHPLLRNEIDAVLKSAPSPPVP